MRPFALLFALSPALALAQEPSAIALPLPQVSGSAPIALNVVAFDAQGAALSGLRWRASATAGSVSGCVEGEPGIYTCTYVPEVVAVPTSAAISLHANGPARGGLSTTTSVTLVPPAEASLSIVANPQEMVLGDSGTGTVTLSGPEGWAPDVDASFGGLDTLTDLGGGRYTARYTPRAVNFPHVALVGAVDQRTGQAVAAPVRLLGKVDFPVEAVAGATVILRIAGREYGPARAGEDGLASVPVLVPPGVDVGTQMVVTDGDVRESDLDLGIPTSRRLEVFPLPDAVPAGSRIPVWIGVATREGALDPAAAPVVSATGGVAGDGDLLAPGVYRAWWTAPELPGVVSVLATLPGERKQAHSQDVRILPARPTTLEVVHDPVRGSGAVAVDAVARDADDNGVSDVQVVVLGGEASTLSARGAGRFSGAVTVGPASREQLVAVVSEPTGLPPASLLITAPRRRTAPGQALSVGVVALDRLGVPVPGVQVSLSVVGGGARITPSVTLTDAGVAVARLRPEDRSSGATVVAEAGGLRASLGVLVLPNQARVGALPTPARSDVQNAWLAASGWIAPALVEPSTASVGASDAETPDAPLAAQLAALAHAAGDPVVPTPTRAVSGGLRLAGGVFVSSYRYRQEPLGDGGPLIDNVLVVGGPDGAGAAHPAGLALSGRWFPEAAPALGVSVAARSAAYGITAAEFSGAVARDALQAYAVTALARLPYAFSRGQLHAGLRVGAEVSDFLYFTGDVEVRFVEFSTLMVPSLTLGVEAGADVGRLHAVLAADQLLAYGGTPFGARVALSGAWDVTDRFSVVGDLGVAGRHITVLGTTTGGDLGALRDGQVHVGAGVGLHW